LIFDMPGRSMNVFSSSAIREIEAFAAWLPTTDLIGVVVRSGKVSAFCAGADLGELGSAYDMIMAAPAADRTRVARDHFAPIGRAFRKLETAGKPVAAAINGLALGGGCEFALCCHYRVLADTPHTALGLPESLVGLLPGAGGTQRMPRLVGLERSLPILLHGARLSPSKAVAAGAAHAVVPAGEEVAAAERWVRNASSPTQPWDAQNWRDPTASDVANALAKDRDRILAETGGHYPAPLAILDCLERGLPKPADEALAIEIDIFAELIKRPEPRNMIGTLFAGKLEFEKRRKAGTLPDALAKCIADVRGATETAVAGEDPIGSAALRFAGFLDKGSARVGGLPESREIAARETRWIEAPKSGIESAARRIVVAGALAAARYGAMFPGDDSRLADYAAVQEVGFPGYLGGPFAVLRDLGMERCRSIAGR
jgi:3-hydroxyacyl-CoA dehydrogenase / enoyl-CoA hydratase / 3-hydroxybutyryl-CoA epimerase